jgi:hypothetical protein
LETIVRLIPAATSVKNFVVGTVVESGSTFLTGSIGTIDVIAGEGIVAVLVLRVKKGTTDAIAFEKNELLILCVG